MQCLMREYRRYGCLGKLHLRSMIVFVLTVCDSAAGDELSWLAPNLGVWFGSLLMRDEQYRSWLKCGRPNSFWITGFFNPQGFMTAMQQEITRAHKNESWALDSVVVHSEVTEIDNAESVKAPPKVLLCSCAI